jgi:hypothetical protein
MRPHRIVVVSPDADDHIDLFQTVEDLQLQALVLEPAVEALTLFVLLRAARLRIP